MANSSGARPKSIGLALGGGGLKGLAHIGLLKLLDKHQIKPSHISGTSMGAIIGALYAHGLSGVEIEQKIRSHSFAKSDGIKGWYKNRQQLSNWLKFFRYEQAAGGMIAVDGLFKHLLSELSDLTFSDLSIPFTAVATDYYNASEYPIDAGDLVTGIKASIAIPVLFAPQTINGRLLVDGGLVNNLPANCVRHCACVIASNVITPPKNLDAEQVPGAFGLVEGSVHVMIHHQTRASASMADIIFAPDTSGIKSLDIGKLLTALDVGDQEAEKLEQTLLATLKP